MELAIIFALITVIVFLYFSHHAQTEKLNTIETYVKALAMKVESAIKRV
jgi:hypothetical protein